MKARFRFNSAVAVWVEKAPFLIGAPLCLRTNGTFLSYGELLYGFGWSEVSAT